MAMRINAEIMRNDYEELFTHIKPKEPPAGLFDRIILAIKKEQELQHTKRLLIGFLLLSVVSLVALPISWKILLSQIEHSGIFYFISTAFIDFGIFFNFWKDFCWAIAESLPVMGIFVFVFNIILVIFTLRLFLYKKRLLIGYLLHSK